jgi:hypothetical protein
MSPDDLDAELIIGAAEEILKRPCSNPRCILNYAHTGPCEVPSARRPG